MLLLLLLLLLLSICSELWSRFRSLTHLACITSVNLALKSIQNAPYQHFIWTAIKAKFPKLLGYKNKLIENNSFFTGTASVSLKIESGYSHLVQIHFPSIAHCRNVRGLGQVSYISKHFKWNAAEWKVTQPSLRVQQKIVQTGALQKLQNFIEILIILRFVYPIHTNSLFWVIFEELPFCHFPPPNTCTSILGKDSQIQLIFHLNILVFQTNRKQPNSFPVLSCFCNCPLWQLIRNRLTV